MESPVIDHERLLQAFPLLTVVGLLWASGTLLYRLFFSPLSKLPGPWLTKISTIPEANALKEQRRARWVTELFEQNPDAVAVRTGPSSVSFNSPDAVKAIYGEYASANHRRTNSVNVVDILHHQAMGRRRMALESPAGTTRFRRRASPSSLPARRSGMPSNVAWSPTASAHNHCNYSSPMSTAS